MSFVAIKVSAYTIAQLVTLSEPPPSKNDNPHTTSQPKEPPLLRVESSRISSESLATLATSDNPNIRRNATAIFLKRFVGNRAALESLWRHLHDPALRSTPDGERAVLAQALLYDNEYRLGQYRFQREDGSEGDWHPYIDEPDGSRRFMGVRGVDAGVVVVSPEQLEGSRSRRAEGRPEEVERRRRRREAVVVRDEGDDGPLSQRDIFVRRRTDDLAGSSMAGGRVGNMLHETDTTLQETTEQDGEQVEILQEHEEIVEDESDHEPTPFLGRLRNLTGILRSRQEPMPGS